MKMKKYFFGVASAIATCSLLSGCATADTYQNTPTSKLCLDYLTKPSVNFNHGARAEELAKRGESCNGYLGAAEIRRKSDAAMERTLNQMTKPATPATKYQQGTHTYIINGRTVTCDTNGDTTSCF
jgi:hypothetical protein